jgi:hypothetical protein
VMLGQSRDLDMRHPRILAQPARAKLRGPS